MNSIISEILKGAFNLDEFLRISHDFETKTDLDPIKQRKQYRRDFVKEKEYRSFRKKLRIKLLASLIVLALLFVSYHKVVVDILTKDYTNSGLILMTSIFLLIICGCISVVLIAIVTINSFNATGYNNDINTFSISFAVTLYFIFIFVYFVYFENLVIDIMFKANETNSYKISSILELIRTVLVFSGSGMLFAWVSNNFKSIAVEQRKNSEHDRN